MRDLSLSDSDTPGLVEHLDIGRRNQFLFGLSGVTSTFSIIGIPVKTFNYKALGGTWVRRAKMSAGISVLAVSAAHYRTRRPFATEQPRCGCNLLTALD